MLTLVALTLTVVGVALLVRRPLRSDAGSNQRGSNQSPALPLRVIGMALVAGACALVLVGQIEATLAFWYWCVWTHVRRPKVPGNERELLSSVLQEPVRPLSLRGAAGER